MYTNLAIFGSGGYRWGAGEAPPTHPLTQHPRQPSCPCVWRARLSLLRCIGTHYNINLYRRLLCPTTRTPNVTMIGPHMVTYFTFPFPITSLHFERNANPERVTDELIAPEVILLILPWLGGSLRGYIRVETVKLNTLWNNNYYWPN